MLAAGSRERAVFDVLMLDRGLRSKFSPDGANLQGANLQGADLRDANLQGANLWDANLRDADFDGADLRYALGVKVVPA